MGKLVRFSISMSEELVEAFDSLLREQGYASRSEAIRDAIRDRLVQHEWEEGETVAGVISLLYDHHRPGLIQALLEVQHHTKVEIVSTTHIHLDPSNCLEFVIVKGDARAIEALAHQLASLKGVKHGKLTATSIGRKLV
jgi:CopG family nickel-responsive transcriptional regulator